MSRFIIAAIVLASCATVESPVPPDDEGHACEALPYGENSPSYEACELASHHSYPVTCTTTESLLVIVNGMAVICRCADVPCPGPPS